MNAKDLLISTGYVFDDVALVWHRSDADFIEYSDGDITEKKLESIVRSVGDKSICSPAWAAAIVDWPTEYHLSSKRANLLRPFAIAADQRVVELGAGCGAITRWLGETGAEVIAVEGSFRRAKIAALRCEDLSNVYVVADDLHATPPFVADWVTLIGVLEYSPVFDATADPIGAVLQVAGQHLKSDGALVVAIENQLGLKYFAGCSEDHEGVPFFGIEGLYRPRGATTFGRRELSDRLLASGFAAQKLLLPFPDYKLPDVIVCSDACSRQDFDAASLVALSVGRDYSGQHAKVFTEPLAWTALSRNGLVADLANSFLFVVARDHAGLIGCISNQQTLAWSYSADRRIEFATETSIDQLNGNIRVSKRLLQSAPPRIENSHERWAHTLGPVSNYFRGERLDVLLLRLAAAGAADEFFRNASKWLDQLLSRAHLNRNLDSQQISAWNIDGDAVDLIPRNVIVDTNGDLHSFDLEWVSSEPIPLSWLVIRGVLSFALYPVNGDWIRSQTVIDLASAIVARRELTITSTDFDIARATDASFLSWVRGKATEEVSWPPELLTTPIGHLTANVMDCIRSTRAVVTSQTHEVSALYDAERIAHAKLIGAYEQSEKSNRSLITELTKAHAFAAEALTHKAVAKQECTFKEAERVRLSCSLVQAESRQQALLQELEKTRERAASEQQLAESRQQALLQELEKTREPAASEQQLDESRQQALLQELEKTREQAASEQQLAESRQQALLQELEKMREQAAMERQQQQTTIHQLELQQIAINSKLIQLTAESATAGAKLGRGITRIHTGLAPVGSTRREVASLTWQFVNSLYESGIKITASKISKYIALKKQARDIKKK